MADLKVPVTSNDHIVGNEHAPVTLVEYGDYACPDCGRVRPIVKNLRKRFGKRLRFVYRHFPLTEIHPHAESAAETADFAGAHGHFWGMHDLLFENQDRLNLPVLFKLAEAVGMSAARLAAALANRDYHSNIRNDFMGGVLSGVNGTPTFFINGERYYGSYEFEDLFEAIDKRVSRAAAA